MDALYLDPYECDICEDKCTSTENLKAHQKNVHQSENPEHVELDFVSKNEQETSLSVDIIKVEKLSNLLLIVPSLTKVNVFTFRYKSLTFGPMYAKDDWEVKDIIELLNFRIKQKEHKETSGDHCFSGVYPTEAVKKARNSLPSLIVDYVDHAFSKSVIAGDIIGIKPKKLQKISEPITNLPTCPDEQPISNQDENKTEKKYNMVKPLEIMPNEPENMNL